MTGCRAFILALAIAFSTRLALSQDIAVGTWRTHNSFHTVLDVVSGNGKVYGASTEALIIYNQSDHSLATVTRLNGLAASRITAIGYDADLEEVLIGHEDGTIDALVGNRISSFAGLADADMAVAKSIDRIKLHNQLAYLACPFGVMVLDPVKLEARETYRDLGPGGENLGVADLDFKGDSIFLATASGVLAGALSQNLLDYRSWRRYSTPGDVTVVAAFDAGIYAGINHVGMFKRVNGAMVQQAFLSGEAFQQLTSTASNLLVCASSGLWTLNTATQLKKISSGSIQRPFSAIIDNSGNLWVGDGSNGMISRTNGVFTTYLPNGPAFQKAGQLAYIDNRVYALEGVDTTVTRIFSNFSTGQWQSDSSLAGNLVDIASVGTKIYVASYGDGLEAIDGSQEIVFTDANSPLQNSTFDATKVLVPGLAVDGENLWVSNDGSPKPLLRLGSDGNWSSFTFATGTNTHPGKLLIDREHRVWIVRTPSSGGGILVFNPSDNTSAYLDDQVNSGGLPSRLVYALAEDRDGTIWMGTSNGVAYFPPGTAAISSSVNAVKPIYQNHYLFQGQQVNAIVVDGGNRKWIGTNEGLWLLGPDGETVTETFNTANSPLPSNRIVTLTMNPTTGELFVGTEEGMVSYRGTATAPSPSMERVKIYPNPVTTDFNGQVSISGLSYGAVVKIIDSRARLVWQGYSNGGTATWNIRDYSGKRPGSGVYVIICSSPDGSDHVVGKIAIVD